MWGWPHHHATDPEPGGDLGHEALVVLHVLEHLVADDAVEAEVGVEVVDVRRFAGHVGEAEVAGPLLNELPLGGGV